MLFNLNSDITDVLNHLLRLSIQDIWGLYRFFLSTISPKIINCSRLYFSGCRITCVRYWSFRVFIVFTTSRSLFIRSYTMIFVMWSQHLIFNTPWYIHISNSWIWLVETLGKCKILFHKEVRWINSNESFLFGDQRLTDDYRIYFSFSQKPLLPFL
jgi:hypothetical protein